MSHTIDILLSWIKIHPQYALFFTFCMAFGESLAFIGGFIPGTMAIVGMGVLAGSGVISIEWNLSIAIVGAVCGDIASFWVGHTYQTEFRNLFFFKKYPKILKYGENFFEKYGGLSVLFGRFLSPIRAVIPAIAGMMNMKFIHFFIANVLSAFGWCGLYFLSGVLVGMGHQRLPSQTRQLIISIIITLFIPLLLLHLPRTLKKLCAKWFGKSLEHLNWAFLNWLTPKHHIFTHFDTVCDLIFTGILIIICIPKIELSQQLQDIWTYFHPKIYQHILNFTHPLHFLMLMLLFTLTCLTSQTLSWILAAGITLLAVSFFSIYTGSTPIFWMMSIGLQLLFCRILLIYKNRFYYPLMLIISGTWFSSAIVLTLNLHAPYFQYLGFGLLAGQMGWFIARKHMKHQTWISYYLLALSLESLLILSF